MFVYPETVSRQGCSIYRLSCSNKKDLAILKYLQDYAKTKEGRFKEIFPWKQNCTPDLVCFIALSFKHLPTGVSQSLSSDKLETYPPIVIKRLSVRFLKRFPPNICGWMNVLIGGDYLYVTKVSTRSPLRPSYGGIGKHLFTRMIEYGRELDKDYIELFPYNDSVRAIYLKWGFVHLEEVDKSNLYYLLKAGVHPRPPIRMELSDRRLTFYAFILGQLSGKERGVLEKMYAKDKERVLNTIEFLFEEMYPEVDSAGSFMSSDKLSAQEKKALKQISMEILEAL